MSIRQVTQDKALNITILERQTCSMSRRGGWARQQLKAVVGILPAPRASLPRVRGHPWICQANSLEPPSF